MKRALICLVLSTLFVLAGCGKDDENANAGTNGTTGTNAATNAGTNGTTGTNNSVPVAGDCEWGEFIAACGGGGLRDYSSRAVGCREYYEPSEGVAQPELCDDEIWDETAACSDAGLSGRRPVGCCFQLDTEAALYTRNCVYDDPNNLESTGMEAQEDCESAGFCWIPPEMM